MEIHYWWVGLSCLVMVLSRGAHTASLEPRLEHSFDLGQLRCCAPKRSDVCPDISHNIPCTVVSDMERRESRISQTLASQRRRLSTNCSESIRAILCETSFPRCVINPDGSHEVQLPARNTCKEAVCETLRGTREVAEICSLYEPTSTTYPVGNCSLPNIPANATHCKIDWYIPAWLVPYVKQINVELQSLQSRYTLTNNSLGWEDLKDVRCKSVGRCWALGDRLEHILSFELCNKTLFEVDEDVREIFTPILGCEFLPENHTRTVTGSTDITLTPPITTQPPSVTTSSTTTPSSFPMPLPDQGGSALISSASISLVLLTVTIFLLVR